MVCSNEQWTYLLKRLCYIRIRRDTARVVFEGQMMPCRIVDMSCDRVLKLNLKIKNSQPTIERIIKTSIEQLQPLILLKLPFH